MAAVDALEHCRRGKETKKCKSIKRQLAALERPSKKYVNPGVWTSLKYEWQNWNKIKKMGRKGKKKGKISWW